MILLVDDQPALRRSLSEYLRLSNYVVLEAEDGVHALQLISLGNLAQIELALLDIEMPNLSGFETYQRMCEDGYDRPVLFLSGYSEEDLPGFRAESSVFYLRKPFTVYQLLDMVKTILNGQ